MYCFIKKKSVFHFIYSKICQTYCYLWNMTVGLNSPFKLFLIFQSSWKESVPFLLLGIKSFILKQVLIKIDYMMINETHLLETQLISGI